MKLDSQSQNSWETRVTQDTGLIDANANFSVNRLKSAGLLFEQLISLNEMEARKDLNALERHDKLSVTSVELGVKTVSNFSLVFCVIMNQTLEISAESTFTSFLSVLIVIRNQDLL